MNRENNGLQAARVDQLGESTPSAVAVLQDGDAVAGSSRCISGRAVALASSLVGLVITLGLGLGAIGRASGPAGG